uniref:Uncharacterized protein n=1 Tax=Arundo donax TaxID=35708 RepID=A0A0A9BZG5_ARUDO
MRAAEPRHPKEARAAVVVRPAVVAADGRGERDRQGDEDEEENGGLGRGHGGTDWWSWGRVLVGFGGLGRQ